MVSRIPPRQPIGDLVEGTLGQIGDHVLLTQTPLPELTVIQSGQMILRYGIRYLGKPHLSIVPALLALDYGDFLTGESAWEFIINKSNLYPRADVVGYRHDGQDEMIVLKLLDLVIPFANLAYGDDQSTKPIAEISGIIAEDINTLAPRIQQIVPVFPSLLAWQKGERYVLG